MADPEGTRGVDLVGGGIGARVVDREHGQAGRAELPDDGTDDGRLVEHPHDDDDVGEGGRAVQAMTSQNAVCTHRNGS